jgi:hypothetical protein
MENVREVLDTLNRMVNEQFETPEFKRVLSLPLTKNRGCFYMIQNALYTTNRRDCWGYVQGAAPLDVKKLIWQHESDELVNDPRCQMDHYTLTVKQGEALGLTPEDFEKAEVPPMVRACFYAWLHIATRNPWLTAFTSSQMLERRNNGEIVKGGGFSFRMGQKFEKELGISLKKMVSLDLHSTADTEHSEMMEQVYLKYGTTLEAREAILQGAQQCMAIDRAYRGTLAYLMEQIE